MFRISSAFFVRLSAASFSPSAFLAKYADEPTTFSGFLHSLNRRSTSLIISTPDNLDPSCIVAQSEGMKLPSVPFDLIHVFAICGDASEMQAAALCAGL